jgi:hypothetical protein
MIEEIKQVEKLSISHFDSIPFSFNRYKIPDIKNNIREISLAISSHALFVKSINFSSFITNIKKKGEHKKSTNRDKTMKLEIYRSDSKFRAQM